MSHPAFTPQPQHIIAIWPVLISYPIEDMRLSWHGWVYDPKSVNFTKFGNVNVIGRWNSIAQFFKKNSVCAWAVSRPIHKQNAAAFTQGFRRYGYLTLGCISQKCLATHSGEHLSNPEK